MGMFSFVEKYTTKHPALRERMTQNGWVLPKPSKDDRTPLCAQEAGYKEMV